MMDSDEQIDTKIIEIITSDEESKAETEKEIEKWKYHLSRIEEKVRQDQLLSWSGKEHIFKTIMEYNRITNNNTQKSNIAIFKCVWEILEPYFKDDEESTRELNYLREAFQLEI